MLPHGGVRRLMMLLGRPRRRTLATAGKEEGATAATISKQARREQWRKEKAATAAATGDAAGPTASQGAGAAQAIEQQVSKEAGGGGATALKFLGGGVVVGAGYVMYQASGAESMDDFLRNSVVARPYSWLYDSVFSPFINPSREKLLPDWHSIPNIPPDAPCPPTLVLDLEDTLVHATWDPKYSWRYAKRPGLDKFLQEMAKYYEIVLFSPSNFGVVDEISWKLDKHGLITHRLYKDATRFHKGKHVKDLSKLNRDLRQVVIVDDDPEAFQFQPENGIRIKPFLNPKDKSDRSLDKLQKFLVALVMEGVQDIPAVLRQFQGMDADQIGDAYESRLRQAKIREMEKHEKGLGGLLRKQKAFKNVANPFPGPAPDKTQQTPRLSAKDIVGGVSQFDEKNEQEQRPPPGPIKKGKLWQAYLSYQQEADEDYRRKMELWQQKQNKREEEARRQTLAAQAAGGQ